MALYKSWITNSEQHIHWHGSWKSTGSHNVPSKKKGGILNAKGGILKTRAVKGKSIISQGISLSYLLDESSIQKITENTWKTIWENFISFGNARAGIIRIYFCIRTVIIDTIIYIDTLYNLWLVITLDRDSLGLSYKFNYTSLPKRRKDFKKKKGFQKEAVEKLF